MSEETAGAVAFTSQVLAALGQIRATDDEIAAQFGLSPEELAGAVTTDGVPAPRAIANGRKMAAVALKKTMAKVALAGNVPSLIELNRQSEAAAIGPPPDDPIARLQGLFRMAWSRGDTKQCLAIQAKIDAEKRRADNPLTRPRKPR